MPQHSLQQVVRWLGNISGGRRSGTDGELLRAYATLRDEAAFAELLRRHGPLVWGVCARSLRRVPDAEDAFQATFLVLARKAAAVRKSESLASWLFGVARRSALLVRQRERRFEPRPPMRSTPEPCTETASAEACDAILDEVRCLPEKYRLPLLLCGLEGLTKSEAARQLGWKEGTVSGRLARARARLHARLVRRGIVTAGSGLAVLSVPRSLLAATVRLAAGETANNPAVSVLATEVLRSMRAFSPKLFASVACVCVLAVTVGGAVLQRQAGGAPPEEIAVFIEQQADEPAAPTWQERLVLRGYAGSGYAEFSPDGRTLATADGQHMLRFLDTTTWKERSRCPMTKYKNGTYFPQWHPFSPDGKLFVMAWRVPTDDGKRRFETWLIEVATGKVRSVLVGNEPRFSPTGMLLTLRRDNSLVFYDYKAGTEVRTLELGSPIAWRGDRFSPDGKRLFTATSDGRGKLWDATTGKAIATLAGYDPRWAKDSTTLATILPGPEIKLWDAATGKERATLRGFNEKGSGVQFSPDGKQVLTTVSEFGMRDDGEVDFPPGGQPYTPKRTRLDVRLWDAATGKLVVHLPGERDHCRGGVFSPDGRSIVYLRLTEGPDFKHQAVVWNISEGKEKLVLRDDKGIDDVTFMPDGTRLIGNVGAHDSSQLHMWDATTGRVLGQIDNAQGTRTFSQDGKLMVISVHLPVKGPLAKPVPTPMELRIFQLSNKPVQSESRGEPVPIEEEK